MKPKEHILEFVFDKVAKMGLKGVSMDLIASELKISKKSLYHYFDGKDDLINSSVKYGCETITSNIVKIASSISNPLIATIFTAVDILMWRLRVSEKFINDTFASLSLGDYVVDTRNKINAIRKESVTKSVEQGYLISEKSVDDLIDFLKERFYISDELKNRDKVTMQTAFNVVTENLMLIATRKGKEIILELKENYS